MAKFDLKGIAMKAAGAGAGAYAAVKLNKVAFVAKQKPAIRGLIKVALGAFLPKLAKGKAGGIMDNVGNGLMAVGALEAAGQFDASLPQLAGIGEFPTLGESNTIVFDENYGTMSGVENTIGSDDVPGADQFEW